MRILLILTTCLTIWSQDTLWRGENGSVTFTSDAPLELITAQSQELKGIIDAATNKFAFSLVTASFQGFNSALQQEHFHENYIESDKFPTASFSGKFIEDISSLGKGNHVVRAKGSLNIHGRSVERIIKCSLEIGEDSMIIGSNFTVPLEDHNITIPQVVYQKIAEEINVEIRLSLKSS